MKMFSKLMNLGFMWLVRDMHFYMLSWRLILLQSMLWSIIWQQPLPKYNLIKWRSVIATYHHFPLLGVLNSGDSNKQVSPKSSNGDKLLESHSIWAETNLIAINCHVAYLCSEVGWVCFLLYCRENAVEMLILMSNISRWIVDCNFEVS